MKIPTIKFVFARKGLSAKDGKGSIDMVITYQRERKFLATGVKCIPGHWYDKNGLYVRGSGADVELNGILQGMYRKAYKIISEMVDNGNIDLAVIPKLLSHESSNITFLQYIMKRMDARKVGELTHRQYVSFYNRLCEYGKIKFFSDISEKAIRDFDEWLHGYSWDETDRYGSVITKRYSQGTIGAYHKNMKAFIADAVVDGFLSENVYVAKRIKVDKGNTRIEEYLTVSEVKRLAKADMPTKSLTEARDLFLLQIMTGLSYIDLMTFDFLSIKDKPEYTLVKGKRQKTGVEYCFVLTPQAVILLAKYGYRLPKLPNQKYNVKLKMVADAAGIDKNLTSHMGRRTCGVVLLNKGVAIEIVSRVLGHSSILMTQKAYARILDNTIVDAFKKL